MANKSVFKSAAPGHKVPAADTTNRAGGAAYTLSNEAALAQYAATGTFNDTFYSTGESQVDEVITLTKSIDLEFIAKTAIYAREQGRMKDMPALLLTVLMNRGAEGIALAKRVFPIVINNSKMLRNVFQMQRSGKLGRKSFATAPTKLLRTWFTGRRPDEIFRMSVGNDPSLGDIIKMLHLSDGGSPERKAFYAYLIDREHDFDSLPPLVKDYLTFKKDPASSKEALPKVPFEMLMGLSLTEKQWSALAQQASWTQLRMNLNTFSRHGVFKNDGITRTLAAKLRDQDAIMKAKPFPYQIFTAFLNTQTTGDEAVPQIMKNALHDALEIAAKNVPTFAGSTAIAVDTSGSMGSPITGNRAGATTQMTCVSVAALIACTFLKKNRESEILPFDTRLHKTHGLDPNDSIMTNADKLRKFGGGGTDCGLALADLNQRKAKHELVVYASDNESWFDGQRQNTWGYIGGGTSMAKEWAIYKARNPKAKLVCIDLQTSATVQVVSDGSVLNIGGFSDTIWEVIASFVDGRPSADHWVNTIKAIQLPAQV
jgi:60 kDa SS-A/Ro ribonucleoprotein